MQVTSKLFKSSAGPIQYLEAGRGEKVLIHFHGAYGIAETFMRMFSSYFCPMGYRIMTPYLPGHGASFVIPGGYKYSDFLKPVKEFVENIHYRKLILSGHSLGGRIAWDLAFNTEIKVKKLIVSAPAFIFPQKSFIPTCFDTIDDFIKGEIDHWSNRIDKGISELSAVWVPRYYNLGKIWAVIESIPKLKLIKKDVDILIMWALDDKVIPFESQEIFISKIKKKKIVLFKGSHSIYLNNPKSYLKEMSKFISS